MARSSSPLTAEGDPLGADLPAAAREVVAKLTLRPHPEGGFYREVFRDTATVLRTPPPEGERRAAVTLIYFLVAGARPTSWHRVASTEIWHHAGGAPLWLDIEPAGDPEEGGSATLEAPPLQPPDLSLLLGDPRNLPHPAVGIVPAGAWQRARSTGEYSLATCTVAPGFEFADFHLRPA